METAFYLYTIAVMLACVAAGAVSLSAYFVSRRHSFLYASIMLLFYFLDLALIFQYEYLGQNMEYSIAQFYTIDHPQLKALLALGTLEPIWLILCDFMNERRRIWRIAPALAFVAASELVVWCLPVDEFRQWLFYTLRQAFLLWCIGYAVFRYPLYQRTELLGEHPAPRVLLLHPARRIQHLAPALQGAACRRRAGHPSLRGRDDAGLLRALRTHGPRARHPGAGAARERQPEHRQLAAAGAGHREGPRARHPEKDRCLHPSRTDPAVLEGIGSLRRLLPLP